MLLPEQVEALRSLERACREIGADVVVIGAIAYRARVANDYRSTEDCAAAGRRWQYSDRPLAGGARDSTHLAVGRLRAPGCYIVDG